MIKITRYYLSVKNLSNGGISTLIYGPQIVPIPKLKKSALLIKQTELT